MDELETMGQGIQQALLINYPDVQEQPATPPAVPVQEQQPEPAEIPKAPEPAPQEAPQQQQPGFLAKPWEEVQDKFKATFPGVDPAVMERDYKNASELASARRRYQDIDTSTTTTMSDAMKNVYPFLGPLMKTANETDYQEAMARLKAGTPRGKQYTRETGKPDDFELISFWEKQQADRGQRGIGGNVAQGALAGSRFIMEQMAGGAIGKTLGLGARAAQALGLGVAAGGQALETSAERASAKGDDSRFYSPENIIPAASMAGIQALILHGAGKWTQGIGNPIAKVAADVGVQFPAMQGTEVAAGALDNFLAPAWKTNTKYGVIGKIVAGEQGPAMQEAASQILTIAALSALHSGGKVIPERLIKLLTEGINEGTGKPGDGKPPSGDPIWKKVETTAEDVLGVKPDATMEEITRAFRKRSMETHPDRGGKADEFQWVDWAYKTLQARAGRGKGPRSRPKGQYEPGGPQEEAQAGPEEAPANEPPPPPYEPQEPPEQAANMAGTPETGPEGPPSPPGAGAAEAPPVTEKPLPEPVPEGIRARMEDLVARRAKARATDDFESELAIGRDIKDLIQEHPRLRETSTYAKPRRVIPDTSDMGEQTPRERVDRLTAQLHSAMDNLSNAKSLESKELMTKNMGLTHRADDATEFRKGWESRVKTLQEKVDAARDELMKAPAIARETAQTSQLPKLTPEQLAGRPWSLQLPAIPLGKRRSLYLQRMRERQALARNVNAPRPPAAPAAERAPRTWVGEPHTLAELTPTIEQLHAIAGLSPIETNLMKAMFVDRTSLLKLAADPQYGPTSDEGIRLMSKRILTKLGYKGTVEDFFKQQKEELQKKIAANGGKIEPGALGRNVQRDERARQIVINRVTAEEARINRWGSYVKELQKDGPLTDADSRSIAASIKAGEQPPGYGQTTRGKKLAAKAARSQQPAPVPSGPGSGVSPDNPQQPAATPADTSGGIGASSGTGGAPAPAGSQLSKAETMWRGRAVPKAAAAEAERMGLDVEHLHGLALRARALDKEEHELKLGALQLARKMSKAMSGVDLRNIKQRAAQGKLDESSIKGLDVVAVSVGKAYPELFGSDESTWLPKLWDMLIEGNPKRLSEDQAYSVALQHLSDLKEATTPTPEMVKEWNDELKTTAEEPLTKAEIGEVQDAAIQESVGAESARQPERLPGEDEGAAAAELDPELFDDSFDVAKLSELESFGSDEPDVTTAGTDRPTEPAGAGSESGVQSGGEAAGVADWQERFEDAPAGTQINFLPGSFGDLVGTQREMFDRTPLEKAQQYDGFKEQRSFLDELGKAAQDFIQDNGGALDLDTMKRAAQYVKDSVDRFAGKSNPATTRLDRETGEALMRWMVADQYGREAAGFYTDLVLGRNATTLDKLKFGQMLSEMRLGFMRAVYRRLGGPANVKAAKAAADRARTALQAAVALSRRTGKAAAGTPQGSPQRQTHERVLAAVRAARATYEHLKKKARSIGKYHKIANNVESTIGKPGLPFQTHQEFFNYRDSTEGKAKRALYAKHVVPLLDSMYERSMGLAPGSAHSRSVTQIPGLTVNLKGVLPGMLSNRPGMYMTGQGPKNLKMRKNKFAAQAKGNAPGYDVDFGRMLENTFGSSASLAAQAEFARTAVKNGTAMWSQPGKAHPDYKQVSPFTAPPKGTQLAKPGQVLYVHERMHGEVMNAFNADHKNSAIAVLAGFNKAATAANLASLVDAASHGLNLTGALLTAPAGRLGGIARTAANVAASKALTGLENKNLLPDLLKSVQKKLMSDDTIRRRLLELTRTGANKPKSHGEGMAVGLAQYGADLLNKQLPEVVRKARYADPTFYLSHAMDNLSDIVRLSMAHAHDHLVKKGALLDTETSRRDFVNQMTGNYERKAMNWLARIFRDTGFGPFVVAGTTMTSRAIKTLMLSSGVRGQGWKGETRLRTEMLAKILAALAASALLNYMRWGRVDGDDNTPRFGIKIGEGADGKTKSLPNPVGMIINRGLRAVPFLSYLVDKTMDTSPPTEAEDKVHDFAEAWAHPFLGPIIQFGHTAWTGKDTMGHKIAQPAGEDSSKPREYFKAALKQANPIYSALTGSFKPGEDVPMSERLAKLMGPFGFKYTEKQAPEVAHLYDLGARLREVQDVARRDAKKQGKMAPPDARLNVIQRAETTIGKIERLRHGPDLTPERRAELRANEVRVATSALMAAERIRKYRQTPAQ